MANEAHDLWALLREARGHVFNWPDYTVVQKRSLLDRIDAALAAHDVVPPSEEKVEWTQDALGYYARVMVEAEIEVFQDLSGEWQWNRTAASSVQPHGHAATLDEAQRAALAAARGMR